MKRDTCVQSTNDFSTLSKVSAASMGYFTDEFQKYFASRLCRRSPLINRGYCVRSQAITHCLREFLEDTKDCNHRQVLSLGCGFDSLYFRTCRTVPGNTSFWEVDFPPVVQRKRLLIEGTEALKDMLGGNCAAPGPSEKGPTALFSENYKLIGSDLSDIPNLESALDSAGIIWDCPTLLLGEVVLCYMDPARSTDVIGWAAQRFPRSRFALYEQFSPDDPFGQVMINHFVSLNSALCSVIAYPQLQDQEQRFLQKGWEQCRVLDMNEFSKSCVPESEKLRVEGLEPFDEFEEFHLKCSHYFILVASNGILADAPALRPVSGLADLAVYPTPASCGSLPVSPLPVTVRGLRRFGHRSCSGSSQAIITTGGFGEGEGKHQRLNNIHLLLREGDNWNRERTTAEWDGRLLHSLTLLTGGAVLGLGGRFSPSCPARGAQILRYDDVTQGVTVKRVDLCPELLRWRHSTTEVSLCGTFYVFVFGGRSVGSSALQDPLFLQPEDMSWVQVPVTGEAPLGCHTHSSCGWKGGAVISGGVLKSGVPSGSITVMRPCESHFMWETLPTTPPLTPRYSHSSHVIGQKLLLVGGVWIHSRDVPGLTIVDLITGHVAEFKINTASLEWPLMLHSHSSVLHPDENQLLLLGGGGTCFSFGTHLNAQPVVLELPSLR
ncbi:tRNA wybutosine-synthesizing protein 4 [Mixophyes fleayi]|uniref:tRNA wybutosine-synthesizing protein 4 n=1 Tax=Mixophyes fleayi TaxID=3061075 RepID=UPI003F4D738F